MPRLRFKPRRLSPLQQAIQRKTFAKPPPKPPQRKSDEPPRVGAGYPALWNAHRRIDTSRGPLLTPQEWQQLKQNPELLFDDQEPFRATSEPLKKPSQDVIDFIDNVKLLPEEKLRLLRNPAKFFAFPENVPDTQRKLLYFPNFVVTFRRTPHLPARYASFKVPIWFSKLDIKDYLRSVYNVETIHVRSFIIQGKVDRKPSVNMTSQGKLFRPPNTKLMTVELEEPFIWPEEIKEFTDWGKDEYWKTGKGQMEENRLSNPMWSTRNPNTKHRTSIAEQAKALLAGKETWKPTWQSMPDTARVLQARNPPRSESSSASL